jgi:RNA polymerase sigma-70 factor (ECF subfamily)
MIEPPAEQVTRILEDLGESDSAAAAELLPLVYTELHRMAESAFRRQRRDHTLQPTALVHEVYVKLVNQANAKWKDRKHFFTLAAKLMRQVLVDYARGHLAEKRGRNWRRVTLDQAETPTATSSIDLVNLDEALARLTDLNERHARIVELRYLAGLSIDEVAEVLDVSRRTVQLDWRAARAWLRRELDGSES